MDKEILKKLLREFRASHTTYVTLHTKFMIGDITIEDELETSRTSFLNTKDELYQFLGVED